MDHAARVAFVMAQTVCAQAELAAMHAANLARAEQGHSPAYGEDAFRAVPDQFLIGHNAVIEYLRG
jgi:hypothetical protein